MRSRYTAFARCDVKHLQNSHDPETRSEFDAEATREWAEGADWKGFALVRTQGGGADDSTGVVEFIARYTVKGMDYEHHEISQFRQADGVWYFRDGREVPVTVRRAAPKVGRNDPCHCGSGRKFKKCCGRV